MRCAPKRCGSVVAVVVALLLLASPSAEAKFEVPTPTKIPFVIADIHDMTQALDAAFDAPAEIPLSWMSQVRAAGFRLVA